MTRSNAIRPLRPLLAAGLASALVLGSCSSTENTSTTSAATQPTTADGDAPSSSGAETEENFASFRGVTADEIHIGVGYIDASRFGFDRGDVETHYQTVIDDINDNGGVAGRKLVPEYIGIEAVGTTAADEACTKFTEDPPQVFAFVGGIREQSILCYTELHDTIAINRFTITQDQIDRSKGLAFSIEPSARRRVLTAVTALDEAGLVDGKKFVIHTDVIGEPDVESVEILLDALGGEVVEQTLALADGSDRTADREELDSLAQKWIVSGADTILAVGNENSSIGVVGAVKRNEVEALPVVTYNNASLYETLGNDPAGTGVIGIAYKTPEAKYLDGDQGVAECVDRGTGAAGEEPNVDGDAEKLNNLRGSLAPCQLLEVLDAIGDEVGANLTNETFIEAANNMGEFEVTGMAAASLSLDKRDVPEELPLLYTYNAEAKDFEPREG